MDTIRIVIVDDHAGFVEVLVRTLSEAPGVEVIGTAHDGTAAVRIATELQPDVMLMDLHMPVMNGIEATGRIVAVAPHIKILVLTMLEDDESVYAAMRARARGYLVKGAGPAEIMHAVQGIHNGEVIFGPGIAKRVMGFFQSQPASPSLQWSRWRRFHNSLSGN